MHPVEDVRLIDGGPTIRRPVLISAFTGWNDAGEGASSAVRLLAEQWGATQVAEIDCEPFTDFATVRPVVVLDDGRRRIVWPSVDLWAASLPAADVLLLLGPEPAMRWRRFCEVVIGLAGEYDVSMAVGLGALLAEYPHRRRTHLTATSTDDSVRERFGLPHPTYEGPTGIVGVLGEALATAGLPTASLWAAVPTYTAQLPAAPATAALVRAVCSMIGAQPPVDPLAGALAEHEAQLQVLLEDEDVAAYVRRLEALMPDDGEDDDRDVTAAFDLDLDDSELVAEVERFLRDADDG